MDFLSQFFTDGMTLEELSEVTGIDKGNLSAIENDRKPIGVKAATKIGLAIGLHPATILFPNGYTFNEPEFRAMQKRQKNCWRRKW